ncbi:hypothetical protein LXL04_020638 [Taraxacum kok-saghyz]
MPEYQVPSGAVDSNYGTFERSTKNYVVAMGFGAALTMRLGKLPRMLSYRVVDSCIRDIYGIPMGDIAMSTPVKANHEDDIVRIWQSQFPKEVKRIRLTHVIEKIVNDSEAGPLFRMNFPVLYVSVMIGFLSMGTLFYLHCTKLEYGLKDDITHPLMYWTSERLKERELLGISKGRLGNVAFSSEYRNNKEGVNIHFCFTIIKQAVHTNIHTMDQKV